MKVKIVIVKFKKKSYRILCSLVLKKIKLSLRQGRDSLAKN